ncbi:TonB-dependent receptor [Flavobacterium lipolyticum]|uniref:TonB-dependent receptor n=1 Tax=Flavobacterium lipolyticum TaxID=2893754 RepID=A0ABS8LYK0_9FLAO|nr:TonB-dependent receptor [Flavobacterium sp. F-126]MCC9017604.1 TonB-dependent receptor [Flavobacterium sp. F-126]
MNEKIKVTLLTMILYFLNLTGYAQVMTLNYSDVSVGKAIETLKEKSGYSFVFESGDFDTRKIISINATNQSIDEIVKQIIVGQEVQYEIKDKIIRIRKQNRFIPTATKIEKITGIITDNKGLFIAGATIENRETNKATISDSEGKFDIEASLGDKLEISYISYITTSITVSDKSMVSIILQEDSKVLDEVIVIGYGKQSKTKVMGSSVQIKAEELNKVAGANFVQQLSGKMAGVQVNETSGQPGSSSKIIIRGTGTLTAGSNPLIVVDGVPLSEGATLNAINSYDIESINVLKDAASAAIYGSRGANGVILVSTKKGKKGAPIISFDYYTGIQRQASGVEIVNANQAAQFFNEARDWGYVSKKPDSRSENDDEATRIAKGAGKRELRLNYLKNPGLEGLANTSWMDEVFRDAPITNYSLGVSGGNEKSNYYISGNYFEQPGIVIETDYKRYTSSIRFNTELSDKFKFGISLNPSYSVQNKYNQDDGFNTNPVLSLLISYPFFSPYNKDGSLAIGNQLAANAPQDGALAENPVAVMKLNSNVERYFRLFGNAFVTYDISDGLQFKTLFGGDYRNILNQFYSPSSVGYYRMPAPKAAVASETNSTAKNIITENTLNYTKNFGKHQIELLAGYTYQREEGNSSDIVGTGIPDDNLPNIAGASAFKVTSSKDTWVLISYLGRAQYFYKEKYQLTGTLRRDGSSRFGSNSKWGLFPSVAGGWIVSKEAFFPETTIFTFAKIRASWGKTGNNQIGSYGSIPLVNPQNYVYGNELNPGFATTSSPNPNLSWETRTSTNLGLDLTIYRKFNFTADFYSSITSDLLLNVPVPQQSGFTTSTQNTGELKNSGFEISFEGNGINLGQVKWNFGGNISTNKSEVLKLGNNQNEIITGYQGSYRTKVGGPIAELYGYNILGIYKTNEQIATTPHMPGTLTGDYIMEDINKDGIINEKDKKGFGSYAPKIAYGFNSSFTYKDFELSFSINGIQGRKKFAKELAVFMEAGEGFSIPNTYYFENRYHPINNPDGFLGQPNTGNFSSNRQAARGSSITFTNADYIRLRDIQIAYNLPKTAIKKIGLTRARIYLSGNNLINITKYRGFNSEAETANILEMGFNDNRIYPNTKSVIFGTNLTF